MNIVESCKILDPYGKESECSKFTIDDVNTPFTLHDISVAGQNYVFSCSLKSEESGSINVGGIELVSSTDWGTRIAKFTATSIDLPIYFSDVGVYYLHHPQLEIGTIATDWTPAPEDTEDAIVNLDSKIHTAITEQSTSIISDCESIIMTALEKYVETSDYEEFQQTVQTTLQLLSDSFTIKIEETNSKIEAENGELREQLNTITKYFAFDVNGLTIASVDENGQPNPNKVVIDDDEISILVNETVVQKFDSNGNALIPELNVTRSMNLFGFVIDQDEAGNVNCEYVGG